MAVVSPSLEVAPGLGILVLVEVHFSDLDLVTD